MSCIKRESFIPLGFPWVISGYEEEVQEHLYHSVYSYASGPLGGKKFLQRFREEWETQISFFLGKGFNLSFNYPIYIYQVSTKDQRRSDENYSFQISTELPFEKFGELIPYDPRYKNNNINELKAFYSDIDFDMIFQFFNKSKTVAMVALTSREDTKYSELNIVACDKRYPGLTEIIIDITLRELSKQKMEYVSMTLEEKDPIIEILESIGFRQRSRSVFYSKEI